MHLEAVGVVPRALVRPLLRHQRAEDDLVRLQLQVRLPLAGNLRLAVVLPVPLRAGSGLHRSHPQEAARGLAGSVFLAIALSSSSAARVSNSRFGRSTL